MLQNIRDKAQGLIAWVIIVPLIAVFALWGINSYLGGGSEPVVAKVDGKEITERALDQRFQQFRQDLRTQLGAAYRPEMFDDKRMRQEVLRRMVRDDLILQKSHDMGLRVADQLVRQTILGVGQFQRDGHFDQAAFERAARLQGLTSAGFEERVRQALLSEQLSEAVQASAFVTEHELKEAVRLSNQTRKVGYFIIPSADYTPDEAFSDAAIQSYYAAHQADYRTPEQVKLDYLLLNAETAGQAVKVSEDALREYYDNHQEKYGLPEERRASHILIRLDKDADEAAQKQAMQKIDELRQRIEEGEDFAALAKTDSQDPGSAEKGGDLGYFGKGIMDPAFEKAVFSMHEGEVSKPIRTAFGLHLIKLTGIKAGSVKPFDDAKAQVEQDYRKSEGEQIYYAQAEKLADLTYEDPSSLEPAANELHLKIQHSGWIDRNSAQGILRSPKVLSAAFSEDVLNERHNSELIELGQSQSLVLRVADNKVASIKPLEEVKDDVIAKLKLQKAAEQAKVVAEQRLTQLRDGASMADVAGKYTVKKDDAAKRSTPSMPLPLLRKIFSTPRPEADKPVYGMAELTQGNVAIFGLYAVNDGSMQEMDKSKLAQMRQKLRNGYARAQYEGLVDDFMDRADISYQPLDAEK